MPVEIHFPHGQKQPSIEAEQSKQEDISAERLGQLVVDGFSDSFELIGPLPQLRHDVTITVEQSRRKQVRDELPILNISKVREGVRGADYLWSLVRDSVLHQDAEPFLRDGRKGVHFFVTIFTEQINKSSLAHLFNVSVEDVADVAGKYARLWMLRFEHSEIEVFGKRLSEYEDIGKANDERGEPNDLLALAAEWFFLKRETEASGA
jgi:hypothetical protein